MYCLRCNPNLIILFCFLQESNKVCFIPNNSIYTKVKKGVCKFVMHASNNILQVDENKIQYINNKYQNTNNSIQNTNNSIQNTNNKIRFTRNKPPFINSKFPFIRSKIPIIQSKPRCAENIPPYVQSNVHLFINEPLFFMFQALEFKNRGIKLNFIPLFFM